MLLILPFVLGTSCKEEVDLQSIRYEGKITALTDMVAHTSNPNTLGGRGRRITGAQDFEAVVI